MDRNNYVNVIGYQFERVHTGIIMWILDTKNSSVSNQTKLLILKRMFKFCENSFPFNEEDIESIHCKPEFSFGRKRKIDLVIEIRLHMGTTKYVVIEMKVDSIPYEKQLSGTVTDFLDTVQVDKENVCFMLMLFGSSQVCKLPNNEDFYVSNVNHIIDLFCDTDITDTIFIDWIASLEEEIKRSQNIIGEMSGMTSIRDLNYWRDRGYRPMFSPFYYLYHQLKLESISPSEWSIYSGNNNPVMNWTPGWNNKMFKGKAVLFYWEFNYQEFVLKVKIDEQSNLLSDELIALRNQVELICMNLDIKHGRRTQNRRQVGEYNSLYKWKFDFLEETFEDIMSQTEKILKKVPQELETFSSKESTV
ncbi:hypothetical protein [Alkalicoccobacillus porphyridii]|uniref:hypothetical protein n=1 Tax=Alkalicoccobacillus porphyridii TaxID=2597270 RepID=UPI00163D5EE9|nr:hypothetical protein [Alkalicoccobacillus porphyridii]